MVTTSYKEPIKTNKKPIKTLRQIVKGYLKLHTTLINYHLHVTSAFPGINGNRTIRLTFSCYKLLQSFVIFEPSSLVQYGDITLTPVVDSHMKRTESLLEILTKNP